MIEFVTFSLTLPYPSLVLINWYLIIGSLMTAGIFTHLLVADGGSLANHRNPPLKEVTFAVFILILGWPYILYLYWVKN